MTLYAPYPPFEEIKDEGPLVHTDWIREQVDSLLASTDEAVLFPPRWFNHMALTALVIIVQGLGYGTAIDDGNNVVHTVLRPDYSAFESFCRTVRP
jgi:hypothetical protein